MKRFLSIILGVICSASVDAQDLNLKFFQPAKMWEETLPLGNGLIGMMPNGKTADEQIVLNEISMWSGSTQDANNYQAKDALKEIQSLLLQGKNLEAEQLVNKNFVCSGKGSGFGNGANVPYGCYQNFGFLNLLHFNQEQGIDYHRTLNLETAISETNFKSNGIDYKREYFTSFGQNVGVIHLTASRKKSIGFALHFYRDERISEYQIKGNEILVSGFLPNGTGANGLKFAAKIKVISYSGELKQYDNQLILKNADQATILVALSSSYYDHDPVKVVEDEIRLAGKNSFDALKKAHLKAYKPLFNRVSLKIEDEADKSALQTPDRLANFFKNPGQDNALAVLYYQFGRYLTLSSTAPKHPKALPPNLQGLWAHQIQTPWNGDYHLNINAQMNHWGLEVGNLSEYHLPFIEYIKKLSVEGRNTAQAYYNAPGWVVFMMSNIWGYTAPGEQASWGASTASGWLCNHLWEHYQFTEDLSYLKDIYPILKEAAVFYQSTMIKDPKTGWLVTSPSVSPENSFFMADGKHASVVMGPTIDYQIVRELYESVIQSNQLLELEDPFAASVEKDLKLLPPAVQVSSSGRVMEWLEDYKETEPKHRHVSHLYGLYPANFISPISTPEWADAAKQTLTVRGDEGTGWSRAWKILFWARLHDGNHALEILRQLLKPAFDPHSPNTTAQAGTYPNLFCAHPPFQIDGNFGGSAGISEMIMQSHDGYIHLLPALPNAWKNGSVKGLKARGNLEVDFRWVDGKVVDYQVRGKKGKKLNLLVNGKQVAITL